MKPAAKIDWPLIRLLADYSDKAYRHTTARDPGTDAEALVTMVRDGVAVAFKGSKEPEDFIQDAKFEMETLAFVRHNAAAPCAAKVHRGFLEDFDALNVAVVSQVKTSLQTFARVSPQPKIYITGHSLGGALAILCALEFARQKLPVAAVITFGQPRVGNKAFATIYNHTVLTPRQDFEKFTTLEDITFHVINADDPVPLFPPLLFGYRDEGNEIFLPRHAHAKINPSIGLQIIDDVLGALDSWRRQKLAFLPNHFIKAYKERIQLA